MASRYWKRMREKAAEPRDDAPAPMLNPWVDPTAEPIINLDTGRTELSASQRAAQYTEWADRMHEKRQRTRDVINGVPEKDERTYWTTDALFADSKRVEEDEIASRPNPWRVQELLSVFELQADADAHEVGDAYRRLAKQHHPDRYVAADPATQQFHAEQMMSINKAYRALKELQRA